MSNTPIQVVVQIFADAKLQGATKQLEQLANAGKKMGQDFAAANKQAVDSQKAIVKQAREAAKASKDAASAGQRAASAGKQQALTAQQLVSGNRLLVNAWREGTNVVDNHYLKSITGLREAMVKFNREAKTAIVIHKGQVKTLDDASLKMERFMMKANLATRTFANMANNLQNVGKNAQWTGRQMMVGITAPLVAIAALSFKSAMEIGKVELQLKKLVDQGQGVKQVAKDMEYLDKQSKALSGGGMFEGEMQKGFGKARSEIKEIQGIFAQIGFKNTDIAELTDATVKFAALGDIDTTKAAEVVRVLRQGGIVGNELTETLAKFNMIEDQTNLSMQDIAESFPKIYPLTKQLGASATETAALLSGITQAGFPASEAANALRASFTKLAPALALVNNDSSGNRLKALKDTFEEINKTTGLGLSFNDPKTGKMRDAVDMVSQLAQAYQVLNSEQGSLITGQEQAVTLIRNMFGGERSGQGVALLESLSKSMDQTTASGQDLAKAMGIARDESSAAMQNWKKQIGIVLNDPTVEFQSQVQDLINAGQDLGKKLIPVATKVLTKINEVVDKFEGMSEGTKKKILMLVAAIALVGPAVYVYGQSLVFLGTIAKGLMKPFGLIFGMRSRFIDTANGVNPLITKLNELTAAFDETGDKKLLPDIEKTLNDLANKRIHTTEAQTKATDANTAAQERLNAARAQGAAIDDSVDLGGGGKSGPTVPDDVVDTELSKRMDARRKQAARDIASASMSEDAGRVITKKKILNEKKADSLQKKIDKAQKQVDKFDADSIQALSVLEGEKGLGEADLSEVKAGRERVADIRSKILGFQETFGVPLPVRPDLGIEDVGDRLTEYEGRLNKFYESLDDSLARPDVNLDGILRDFRNGEPEQLHDVIKGALDASNGIVDDVGLEALNVTKSPKNGRKNNKPLSAVIEKLAELSSDGLPQLRTGRIYDELRDGLNEGVLKNVNDMDDARWRKEIEKAMAAARRGNDPVEWAKKNSPIAEEVERYVNSVKKNIYGKSMQDTEKEYDKVTKKIKELRKEKNPNGKLLSRLEKKREELASMAIALNNELNPGKSWKYAKRADGTARTPKLLDSKSWVRQHSDSDINYYMKKNFPESRGPALIDKSIKTAAPDILEEIGLDPSEVSRLEKIAAKKRYSPENAAKAEKALNQMKARTEATNVSIRRKNAERSKSFIENWIKSARASGNISAYADEFGMPEELKKTLASALFGDMYEGNPMSGKSRGGKQGFRGVFRDLVGKTGYEDDAMSIVNELAAEISQGLPGANPDDTATFRKQAKRNALRAQTVGKPKFEGEGASRLKKGTGQRAAMLDEAQASVRAAQDQINRDKARIADYRGKLKQLAADEQNLFDQIDSATEDRIEALETRHAKERTIRNKALENELKANPAVGKGSINARKAIKQKFADEELRDAQRLEENIAAERRKAEAKKTSLADNYRKKAYDDEIARAESRIKKSEANKRGASRAVNALTKDFVDGGDDMNVLEEALKPQRKRNGQFMSKLEGPDGRMFTPRQLDKLVGNLSPEMADSLHEFMANNEEKTVKNALKVVKQYHPEMGDDIAEAYAGKLVEVNDAIQRQFAEASIYTGQATNARAAAESAAAGRDGRVSTNDNRTRQKDLSLDDSVNEQARKKVNQKKVNGVESMVDDLTSGFAPVIDDDVKAAEKISRTASSVNEEKVKRAWKAVDAANDNISHAKAEMNKIKDEIAARILDGTFDNDTKSRLDAKLNAHRSNLESAEKSLDTNRKRIAVLTEQEVTDAIPEIEEVEKTKKRVAKAEDVLADLESEADRLDAQEAKAHRSWRSRRAAKIGAAKKKILAEAEEAQKELTAAQEAFESAHTKVYEVFDLDTKELVEYKSLAEYRAAKAAQAEKAASMLDMSDIEEAERAAILAELEESYRRNKETEALAEAAAARNAAAHADIYDDLDDIENAGMVGTEKSRFKWEGNKAALIDEADDAVLPVAGRGRIRRGIKKAGSAVKGDYTKKKGGLLNPVNLINMINPLKKASTGMAGLEGATAGVGAAAEGATGPVAGLISAFSGSIPQLVVAAAPIIAVVAVIAAAIAVLVINFNKWKNAAQDGIDAVKKAFKGLWDAVKEPIVGLWDAISGTQDNGANQTGSMWKNVGEIIGKVFQLIALIVRTITPVVSGVMQVITKIIFVFVQVFRVIMAVLSGDWSDAWEGMKKIFEIVVWGIKKLWTNMVMILVRVWAQGIKGVLNGLGKIAGFVGKVPGLDFMKGWEKSLKQWNTNTDNFVDGFAEKIDNWVGPDPLKSKKKGKKSKDDFNKGVEEGADTPNVPAPEVDPGEAEDKGKEAVQNFISAFQGQLQKIVDGWKEAALDAFDKYSEGLIEGVDKRIKAIDDEVDAERKRSEDLDYLARKDELRQQRKAALLKYHADYDAAIYEGRYDEAKQLTYDHQRDMNDLDKEEQEVDKDRQQQLTDRTRDEARKRLEIEKDNLQKILAVRKDQLQKQLDLMTEYIPKNVAAAQLMHQAIQNKMMEFTNGYGKIGADQAANWNKGWGDAFAATKKQVAEEAYWSGDAAMKFFAAALGIDIVASDKSSAGPNGGASASNNPGYWQAYPSTGGLPTTGTTGSTAHLHTGGHVGPKNSNAHDIPATLQSGEYVVKRSTVQKLGTGFLDRLNSGAGDEMPFFHTGGYVSPKATKGMKAAVGNATRSSFKKAADLWGKGKAKLKFGTRKYSVDDYKSALRAAAGSVMDTSMAGGAIAPGEFASGLLPEFVRRFQAWNKEMGGKFSIGSGFRTMAEQARLYARWLARVPGQAQAAPPGSSMHNFGLAIDLAPSSTTAAQRAAGAKYGLEWPMSYEPWHVQPVEAKAWRAAMRKGNPLANMGIGAGSTSPSGLVIRPGLVSGGSTGSMIPGLGNANTSTPAGPMARILKTIRTLESGGNYQARNKYSTASGAYQYVNGTWNNYGGYANAAMAPASVQDARAASDVRRFLASYNNDLRAVPGNWYNPAVFASGNWDKEMGYGNPLTMRKYIAKWMGVYDSIKEYHKGGLVLPAMDTGGYVVQDGVAQVHKGETVLTKKLTDALNAGSVGGDVEINLHFEGGFFGTDRELEKLQLKLEQDIVPKIQKARGVTKTSFKGVTK
jgi:TP901 family phage tail tape measure protein